MINEDEKFEKAISFINESLELGKHETEDVFAIELFIPIYEDVILVEKLREVLKGKALDVFSKGFAS